MRTQKNAGQHAGQPSTELTLEQLPNGEFAWLRPISSRLARMERRYRLTDLGRRAIEADPPADCRLVAAAEALLEMIDCLPIRAAALAADRDLYETAAALKDAIAACRVQSA
jgi:hypothetical protein